MKHLILICALIATLAILTLLLPTPGASSESPPVASHFAIDNVRVFDGHEVIENTTVIVQDGRVRSVGINTDTPDGIERIDGSGKTLLPGLIDGHAHSFGDSRADAVRFGVTTVLDMFTAPEQLLPARQQRASLDRTTQADLFSAGILATAPGGHGTQYGLDVPTLEHPDEAADWVAERIAEGSDYIKIVIEPLGGRLPTLNAEIVTALVEATHAHDVLALAHASTLEDATMALNAGVDGLVHIFQDQPVPEAFVDQALESGLFFVPTAIVLGAMLGTVDGSAWLEHDHLGPRLSPVQRQSLTQPGWATSLGQQRWPLVLANIQALHQAGVPIIAGSDAPNPGTGHGISVHHELQLLVEVGLTPIEALMAASSVPAEQFDLEGRGCVKPGCRADLLLVTGNPMTDILATAAIERVWKNGHEIELAYIAPTTEAVGRDEHDLLAADERQYWQAASDQFMGGQSTATMESRESGLLVRGQLLTGAFNPYSGAMWMAGFGAMEAVDLADRRRLTVRIKGDSGPFQLMIFSGASPGAMPVMLDLVQENDRFGLAVELADLTLLEAGHFRAFGIFATGQPRDVEFEIVEARLE